MASADVATRLCNADTPAALRARDANRAPHRARHRTPGADPAGAAKPSRWGSLDAISTAAQRTAREWRRRGRLSTVWPALMVRLVRKSLSLASLAAPVAPLALAIAGLACNSPAAPSPSAEVAASSSAHAPAGKLRVVEAPSSGSVDAVVRDALAGARAESRTLVVYVGATWCEPCQNFHRAAARGDLDAAFPHMTLLEFDLDRDRERLASAGYVSKYIPLFALPGPDGAASGKQVEGGIKGDGAVGYISSRLTAMLSE